MKIAVVTNPKSGFGDERQRLLDGLKLLPDFCLYEYECGELDGDTDRTLVFGGDGTVLWTARLLEESGVDAPIVGVNVGGMGFHTAFERSVSVQTLAEALRLEKTVNRPLLDCEICDGSCKKALGGAVGRALNDVVIKSEGPRPIKLELYVDGNFVDMLHGDGLIICTAAGSTAYSLSAGGPVLAPDVEGIVLNPICAHSLHSRPLVVSSGASISVRLVGVGAAYVSVDGNPLVTLANPNFEVRVRTSKKNVRFVDCGDGFYGKLLSKMNNWGTTENK